MWDPGCDPWMNLSLIAVRVYYSRRYLVWKERIGSNAIARAVRKETGVIDNKYIPFVYVLDHSGMVRFKACGAPLENDWDVLATVLKKLTFSQEIKKIL